MKKSSTIINENLQNVLRIAIVFFLFVSFSILSTEPKRPKGVPEKAKYDAKLKIYSLMEPGLNHHYNFKTWYEDGSIFYESFYINDREYTKQYHPDGSVAIEGFTDELNKPVERKRPENIPKEANWNNANFAMAWEYGKTVNGKREGIWKLWYESGKPKGFRTYKNGLANGETKIYREDDGVLEEIIIMRNGVITTSKTFVPKKFYTFLKNPTSSRLYPLPDNEPKIQDFFDKL